MSAFNKVLSAIDTILIRFLQALLLLVTAAVTWQVFSRYVLNAPSSFTEELARFLLIWITLLGCAYAYRKNVHLGLDMIYSSANESYRKVMYFIIHSCVGFFAFSVMVIGGYQLVNMTNSLGQSSPVLGVDIGTVYLVIPLSGLLIVLFAINSLIQPNYNIDQGE